MIHFWVSALCPSKSGLMNKHIVKHIVVFTWFGCGPVERLGYGICTGLSGLMIHFWVPALCPSESGLMNKHIVRHIVSKKLLYLWGESPLAGAFVAKTHLWTWLVCGGTSPHSQETNFFFGFWLGARFCHVSFLESSSVSYQTLSIGCLRL